MLLVDAHVHLHACFSPARFLDAAARNIGVAAQDMEMPDSTPGMLLFTHSAGEDAFGGLRAGAVGRWRLAPTREPVCLRAERGAAPPLFLVAGRQIATAEGLEVLALGAAGPFADGQSVAATIDGVRAHDGVPVIPWGFGKWWRRRGETVRRVIADHARFPLLFLGDNAGRPRISRRPSLFAEAEQLGRVVLPGTDPLPFPAEQDKVGRLVFQATCDVGVEKPFAELGSWLMRCQTSPPGYGLYERTGIFLHRQVAMQLHKRRRVQAN